MSTTIPTAGVAPVRAARPVMLATLWLVTLAGLYFVVVAALPYFGPDRIRSASPRRWVLLLHIATGIVALFSGPVQLWLGLTDARPHVHRRLGALYLASIAISSMAAYYLAATTDVGFGFSTGLAGLATAWVITSGLAYLAIRRHLYELHKEWMIRSYVVTTGFISFRALTVVLAATGTGDGRERAAVAAWFCWSVPLLVTEALLQGRKILAARRD
jgi:uncharacterized membrane protein